MCTNLTSTENENRLEKIQPLFPEIEALFKESAEKNHFPGYAYGILLDGQLVFSGSGGFIDLDKKVPATPQSMFRIASMTKSFTAMSIMKLRDEGKLKLDDPITLYIPEMQIQKLTTDSPAITIRDLLTHAAGLPADDPWVDRKLHDTDAEFLALLKKGLIVSNPPEIGYEYSSLGYALLGQVIQRITGTSCGEYIRSAIWQPMGLEGVEWAYTKIPESQLAHGYGWIDGQWKEEALLQDGAFGPMGGMIASIESFSRYVAYHQSAWPPRDEAEFGPIKRSSLREMQQPWNFAKLDTDFKYSDDRQCAMVSAYGYGLQWLRDSFGRVLIGHPGGLPGFGSSWYMMPNYGLAIIIFANVTYAQTLKMSFSALDKLSNQLKPRELISSQILKTRQSELMKLLPHWENAPNSGIFSDNFFLDRPLESLKKESSTLFSKAGKILSIEDIVPENQLKGHFILKGEKADLQVNFALTSESPGFIQQYQIKELIK